MGFALLVAGVFAALAVLLADGAVPLFGLEPEVFARLAMAVLVGVPLFGMVVASSRGRIGQAAASALAWVGLLFAAVAGYSYRYELQAVADRVMLDLVPGRVQEAEPGTVTVARGADGHFTLTMAVNGARLPFLFDTGASTVVLRHEDAARAGVEMAALSFVVRVSTANGAALAAPVRLARLAVGSIEARDVRALVVRPGALGANLLGQSFVERLAGYSVEKGRLTLRGPAR